MMAPEDEYQPRANAPTVMVIDDSPSIRTIIHAAFARIGIPVLPYPNGIAALAALTRDEVPVPDLVLLDIGMPKMDGYEVASILRSTYGPDALRIVMLTAHDGPLNRVHSKWIGAAKFIAKPFRVSEVVRIVCELLGYQPPQGHEPSGWGSGATD
jgi:twitching motility two-component system response regulator PilG